MQLFSSTAVSRKDRESFFSSSSFLLHSLEVFLLTWSIIKNQSNKVTFSNLNTRHKKKKKKKLNCQTSLPNSTVAPTLNHRDFSRAWFDSTFKVHTFNFIRTSLRPLRQVANTKSHFFLFIFHLLESYLKMVTTSRENTVQKSKLIKNVC